MTGPMRTGAFTRSDVHEHLNVGRVGLYALWGPSDVAGRRRVYVGKGVLRSRIGRHLRQKFFSSGRSPGPGPKPARPPSKYDPRRRAVP
jgi:hypothetical protein